MRLIDRFRTAAGAPSVARSMSMQEFYDRNRAVLKFAGVSQHSMLQTSYGNTPHEEIGHGLDEYRNALSLSPPAFGAQLVRSLVLSQAGFGLRRNGETITDHEALSLLHSPWPKGSSGELITRMEWHDGLAGNAFVYRNDRQRRLYVPRPDWMTIVHGSQSDPEDPQWQLDAEVVGYLYHPGGRQSHAKPWFLLPEVVAHWSPLPDPLAPERGMSWMTPLIREIEADVASTTHKVMYFEKGATPNLVVTGIPATNATEFDEWVEVLDKEHTGLSNAWKTLYFTAGAEATVVGSHLKDIDYKALQGVSETRISVASRVPAPVLGISEGLAGSSLNAGNFGQARRNFADVWVHPTLKSLTRCLAAIIDVPDGYELVATTDDMPFLREDAKDAAEITKIQAETIGGLVREGFTPDSSKTAVMTGDMANLEHTGRMSVQLQTPGEPADESATD